MGTGPCQRWGEATDEPLRAYAHPTIAMKTEEAVERAQLIRAYEANCRIGVPTEEDKRLRHALSLKIGLAFALKGLRKRYDFEDAEKTPPFTKAACPHN